MSWLFNHTSEVRGVRAISDSHHGGRAAENVEFVPEREAFDPSLEPSDLKARATPREGADVKSWLARLRYCLDPRINVLRLSERTIDDDGRKPGRLQDISPVF